MIITNHSYCHTNYWGDDQTYPMFRVHVSRELGPSDRKGFVSLIKQNSLKPVSWMIMQSCWWCYWWRWFSSTSSTMGAPKSSGFLGSPAVWLVWPLHQVPRGSLKPRGQGRGGSLGTASRPNPLLGSRGSEFRQKVERWCCLNRGFRRFHRKHGFSDGP